ncbi:hypothetical protein BC830DRAFT_1104960 [Chytriomyces sp. MP71]|nr:hypothetical protein BC830DRAFT_1104960 [Chytriomyces sp. MP71]
MASHLFLSPHFLTALTLSSSPLSARFAFHHPIYGQTIFRKLLLKNMLPAPFLQLPSTSCHHLAT